MIISYKPKNHKTRTVEEVNTITIVDSKEVKANEIKRRITIIEKDNEIAIRIRGKGVVQEIMLPEEV